MDMQQMKRTIPEAAHRVLAKLNRAGFEAYLVGGCVRDLIMERTPTDFDLATSARPEEVEELFVGSRAVGKRYGTVVIDFDEQIFEITTMRRESTYLDGRRPERIEFTDSLIEDLKRRDFTINALAFNGRVLYDLGSGIQDIRMKTIRAVGDPEQRFSEDGLRILRAVRFACQLVFSLHPRTYKSMGMNASILRLISRERIRNELEAILLSPAPDLGIAYLAGENLLEVICWGLNESHISIDRAYWQPLTRMPLDLVSRISLFFLLLLKKEFVMNKGICKVNKEKILDLLKSYSFSERTIGRVVNLLKEIDFMPYRTNEDIRWMMNRLGKSNALQHVSFLEEAAQVLGYETSDWADRIDQVIEANQVTHLSELAITGRDLIITGVQEGPMVGQILNVLMREVLRNPSINNRASLLEISSRMLKNRHLVNGIEL